MTNTKLRVQKLRLLEEEFGSLEYLLEEAIFNGVDMGICMNPECDYTTTVEPDSDKQCLSVTAPIGSIPDTIGPDRIK